MAAQQEPLRGEGQQQARSAIRQESDNVRAAWEWAARRDAGLPAQAMDALGMFLEGDGRFQDGVAAFAAAVACLQTRPPSGERGRLLTRALIWQSVFAQYRGQPDASTLLDDSLALLEQLAANDDMRREQAFAWRAKGVLLHHSNPAAAEPYLQKSLAAVGAGRILAAG